MATLKLEGVNDLMGDLYKLAGVIEADHVFDSALKSGAQIISDQTQANILSTTVQRTGDLAGSVRITPVKTYGGKFMGKKYIQVNVEAQSEEGFYYARSVEFGHGGPVTAGAYPFMRPAYDARKDEAYDLIRDAIRQAIDKIGD